MFVYSYRIVNTFSNDSVCYFTVEKDLFEYASEPKINYSC